MIVDDDAAARIGLDWLRAALAPVGVFGRRADDRRPAYGPGEERAAAAEIAEVAAHAARIDADATARLRTALRAIPDVGPIVARAVAGDALGDVDFYELGRFADAVDAFALAWDAAGAGAARRPPSAAPLAALLAPGRAQGGFYLAEAFDPALAPARARFADAQNEADARRASVAEGVRSALGVDAVGDEFVLLRDVHDGPLPAGVRVVRETPGYRLLTVAVAAPARDDALAALAHAEEHARAALAERVAFVAPAVHELEHALGALDRLLARVAFVQRWGGCVPDFADECIAYEDATYAPLADALARRGLHYTTQRLELRGIAVLTGPNMGGKSAALASAGFLCACAALGVPPPAARATLPLLARIAWIGGEGPELRERLLSSYGAEVVRAGATLAAATSRTLVLVDEFARTTGPREGRALLVAFAEALRVRGAFAFIATHLDGVGEAAGAVRLRIAGLRAGVAAVSSGGLDGALDAINAAMDYRVVPAGDAPAASDALVLAALLGLDDAVVRRARALFEGEA